MSKSLRDGYLYINGNDYITISKKLYHKEDIDQDLIDFSRDICVEDYFYEALRKGPCSEEEIKRALFILSLAAVKSDFVYDKIKDGYSVTIRGTDNPYDIHEPCYIFVNGEAVFHIFQAFDEDCTWKVLFMHPQACLDDTLLYAVLDACA